MKTHKYLRDNAASNNRHSHSPRLSVLSHRTNHDRAHKNSLTVDRYFSIPRDSHVGPSANHYMIPTVPTVQGLNIIDSETVLVTHITNRDIVSHIKLIFNFSTHQANRTALTTQIKNYIRNEWCNRYPSKYEIEDFLSEKLMVYPHQFKPNPQNQSGSNYEELVERIHSVARRIYFKQGLKRTNLPGKRSMWLSSLTAADMDAFEDPSSCFKRAPVPAHQVTSTFRHTFS